jgi:hypothetical protein
MSSRRRKRAFLVATVIAAVTGCSTYAVNRYQPNAETVAALKPMHGRTAAVAAFTSTGQSPTQITCRALGPIKTPDGETYAEYLRKGFIAELESADLYDAKAPVTLSANLDSLDFNAASGHWRLGATMKSTNGKTVSATEDYKYSSSFNGETACNQTAQALLPAMQDLISKIVRSPDFPALLNP